MEMIGNERGWITGVRCVRMELGEPGEDGRRGPVAIPGSELRIDASLVIVAVGTSANPLIQSTTPDLKTTRKNYIEADPETLRTSKKGVFAGGDIVTGSATVILAMGAGRKAARAINEYLTADESEQEISQQARCSS
jgi:glutamate synthase (NADPH/NADH) small chain